MKPPLPPQVAEALRRGQKIEAIKRLREATGVGLAEAKGLVDAWAGRATEKAGSAAREKAIKAGKDLPGPKPTKDSVGRGLSPGEVPRSADAALLFAILAAVAIAAWLSWTFA